MQAAQLENMRKLMSDPKTVALQEQQRAAMARSMSDPNAALRAKQLAAMGRGRRTRRRKLRKTRKHRSRAY